MFDYHAPDQLLKDRVMMITGAGDGIGKAAAITFARYGATCILLGRTTSKLEETYDQIEKEDGLQPAIVPLNLEGAKEHDYDQLVESIESEFGRVDGLLHNASLLGKLMPLEQYDAQLWQRVMQVNVNAGFMLTKALMPLLRSSQDASIAFTSSSVGRKGRAFWGAYAVSKFATEGMMQLLSDELDGETPQIRCNSINPGATRTSMRADAYPGEDPGLLPTPEDIMPLYLYLMGPDSQGITGQAFNAQ